MKTIITGLLLLSLFKSFVSAQTTIPNQAHISGVWTAAGSPYQINGEAIVPEGQTLIIKPGVRIEFKTGTNHEYVNPLFDLGFLRIQGTLQVNGTPDSLVIFTRQGENGNWGLLFFEETASDSCVIRFARIEHASYIQYLKNWLDFTGALSIENSALRLENVQLANNAQDGLFLKTGPAQLINVLINNNGGYGIRALSESDLQITNCTLVFNQQAGFACGVNSQPQLINSILFGNAQDLEIGKYSVVSLNHCLLQNSTLPEQTVAVGRNFPGKNPHFVKPDAQDYHLQPNSWAVNTGLTDTTQFAHTATDFEGKPRIAHGRIDLGALERNGDFLRLAYPIGHESFLQNSTETIRWNASVSDVEIFYSTDQGASWQFVANTSGQVSYDWQVPPVNSEQCFIRVTASSAPSVSDQSDTTFIISDHTIVRPGLAVAGEWSAAGSPIEVRGPTFVPKDSTLKIEPGVTVQFRTGQHFDYSQEDFDAAFLQVKGHLNAVGTAQDSIVFTSADAEGHWGGLIIQDADSAGSVLQFVKIEKAFGVDSLEGQNFTGALNLTAAAVLLRDAHITQNARHGLVLSGHGSHQIERCLLEHNGLNGLLMQDNSRFPQPEISNSRFRFNGRHGLHINGIFEANIHDNVITHNDSCGIKLSSGYAVPHLVNNRLGYQPVGILCDYASAKLVGNVLYHCSKALILDHASPDLGNLTLADNSIAIWGESTNTILTNILFANNTADFSFPAGDNSAPGISYSLTDKGFFTAPVSDLGFNRYNSKTNFSKQAPHYYALTAGAAAIDRGTQDNTLINLPQNDVAGKPRIMDGNHDGKAVVDIGAYEFAEIKADFKAKPTAGALPLTVQFNDQSVGEVDTWHWDFGDGATDSVPNPEHIYTQPGRFAVRLIVSGKAGSDTLLRSNYIYAKYPPQVCNPVTDQTFNEDSGWHFCAVLNQVFCDADSTSSLSFSVTSSTTKIKTRLTQDSLFLSSATDFFGEGQVFIKATDAIYLSARDTFSVTIRPVNDPPYFEQPLPDSLTFRADSSVMLNLWNFVNDVETPDSLLIFNFTVNNDSILVNWDRTKGQLTIQAAHEFLGSAYLHLSVLDDSMAQVTDSVFLQVTNATAFSGKNLPIVPQHFFLGPNFPNPFNPRTTITFGLPSAQQVELLLFDLRGRKIALLRKAQFNAGVHQLILDAQQLQLSSGIYFLLLKTPKFNAVRKMVLLK